MIRPAKVSQMTPGLHGPLSFLPLFVFEAFRESLPFSALHPVLRASYAEEDKPTRGTFWPTAQ